MTELKQTPLFPIYSEYGGKTVDFGGWALPVQFSSIKEEHEVVRTKAGLFDVSHMGEFEVKGVEALAFLQKTMTNDVSKLKNNRAQYTAMCYKDGGTVDDLLIYKKADGDYLLVVNASNIDKDFAWLESHKIDGMVLTNISNEVAQLALQGPLAEKVLQKMTDVVLSDMRYFSFLDNVKVAGKTLLLSRTGYTGEDGFELYCKSEDAVEIWKTILEDENVSPCGLGARDTLRFEAVLPLYGQELSKIITPIEAGIGFAVKTDKEADFFGKQVLKEQKENGPARKIVGIEMIDKGIPRHDYPIFVGEKEVGVVTTGTQSPTNKRNIGLALLPVEYTALDTEVEVQIRQKKLKAKVVKTPFYKR